MRPYVTGAAQRSEMVEFAHRRFVFVFHLLVSFCFTRLRPEGCPLICCHTELFYMTSHNPISSLGGLPGTFGRPCWWDEDISTSADWNLWAIIVSEWSHWVWAAWFLIITFKVKPWKKMIKVASLCPQSCFNQPLPVLPSCKWIVRLRYISLI